MISSFPTSLAFIDANSIKERRVQNYRRDQYESGPQRQSKTDCKPIYELSLKLQICEGSYDDFLDWFNEQLCQGMRRFKMLCPIRGEEFVYRFVGNELDFNFIRGQILETNIILERW